MIPANPKATYKGNAKIRNFKQNVTLGILGFINREGFFNWPTTGDSQDKSKGLQKWRQAKTERRGTDGLVLLTLPGSSTTEENGGRWGGGGPEKNET